MDGFLYHVTVTFRSSFYSGRITLVVQINILCQPRLMLSGRLQVGQPPETLMLLGRQALQKMWPHTVDTMLAPARFIPATLSRHIGQPSPDSTDGGAGEGRGEQVGESVRSTTSLLTFGTLDKLSVPLRSTLQRLLVVQSTLRTSNFFTPSMF